MTRDESSNSDSGWRGLANKLSPTPDGLDMFGALDTLPRYLGHLRYLNTLDSSDTLATTDTMNNLDTSGLHHWE